jgi:RNA polymerase sigma-70 factor (ECF subfamily)
MKAEARALGQVAMVTDSDEGARLLARHRDGDPAAFGLLVHRYRSAVYGTLLRGGVPAAVADDLFQETFLRVHQAAGRFRPETTLKAWLLTITTNLLRSHYRKAKVRRVLVDWWLPAASPAGPRDDAPTPERQAAAREELAWLSEALDALPEDWRQALVLTQVEGLSTGDAAAALGVPAATVRTWVHRGRLALAKRRARTRGGLESDA